MRRRDRIAGVEAIPHPGSSRAFVADLTTARPSRSPALQGWVITERTRSVAMRSIPLHRVIIRNTLSEAGVPGRVEQRSAVRVIFSAGPLLPRRSDGMVGAGPIGERQADTAPASASDELEMVLFAIDSGWCGPVPEQDKTSGIRRSPTPVGAPNGGTPTLTSRQMTECERRRPTEVERRLRR